MNYEIKIAELAETFPTLNVVLVSMDAVMVARPRSLH
jgi:hypothetical protein